MKVGSVLDALIAERKCPRCNRTWQRKVDRPDRQAMRPSICYDCRQIASTQARALTALAQMIMPEVAQPQGMRLGLCRQVDPDLWFPERGNPTQAKRICGECPARAACLQWALDTRQRHGVWGGTTWREREAMLRARGAS